ncbi:hypothetical protein AB835_08035 [Candidatus Endobugula sertula]|uniref:Uncharacterized protein n=1 Tax=Candidatus Endobugula sertula TaxID=62101 RepID=A0A1D2QPR5_9GAMM|nr:hypothetical protein AB835_08035 [Candidatus Endobugula sertula]
MGFKTKLYQYDRIELIMDGDSDPLLVIDINEFRVRSGTSREEVTVNITAPKHVTINKTQRRKPVRTKPKKR